MGKTVSPAEAACCSHSLLACWERWTDSTPQRWHSGVTITILGPLGPFVVELGAPRQYVATASLVLVVRCALGTVVGYAEVGRLQTAGVEREVYREITRGRPRRACVVLSFLRAKHYPFDPATGRCR
ncbi:hypothetical protein Halar_0929 [halophilic archaeon DL31]|nr:hypothetical protein Halar_0929 [halophilic archaeon DL31]